MSSTTYAKRTAYKPIDFFFRAVAEVSSKKVRFVDAFQILNDRYLGRMNVCNYFFIAENSLRINELNVIALDELKNYDLVMCENFLIPENTVYFLPITTRFLENERDFEVLLATLKENGYKKNNIVIGFNCNTLINLDDEARKRYARLRRLGYPVCVCGFGEEFNQLDIFARFGFEYLRAEASYFDADAGKKKLLKMLVKYCAENKINFVMEGVDTPAQLKRFKREGVKLATGRAVSKLSRWVTRDLLGLAALSAEEKEEYLKKLEKRIQASEKAQATELEELRARARERMREVAAEGKLMPSAPRPELAKSPYQVRLEQQKLATKRALLAQDEEKAAERERKKEASASLNEKKILGDLSFGMFEGGLQSALAVTFAADEAKKALGKTENDKAKKRVIEIDSDENKSADVKNAASDTKPSARKKKTASAVKESAAGSDKDIKDVNENKKSAARRQKSVVADHDKEQRLLGEIRGSSLFDALGQQTSMGGFGVKIRVKDSETEEEVRGSYNEKGQWTDEDGSVYNGYFDEDGVWRD